MASTYYDWHFANSQRRMEQNPLFDNGVQIEKYHYRDGMVLNFLSVVSGKQITILLDHKDTLGVRNQINTHYPTDEVTRLRLAMTSIKALAKCIGTDTGIPYYNEVIRAILDEANIK